MTIAAIAILELAWLFWGASVEGWWIIIAFIGFCVTPAIVLEYRNAVRRLEVSIDRALAEPVRDMEDAA